MQLKGNNLIAVFSAALIALSLLLHYGFHVSASIYQFPLLIVLLGGGIPLVFGLFRKLLNRDFGSDLLAGIAVVTSILLGEYLAGAVIVLMLSGGAALENYAVKNASSVLKALAKRMPTVAHRRKGSELADITLGEVRVDDTLVIFPHEICPVDGVVLEGHGRMDEAYLTGEPFLMDKAPGSAVISGAVNGDTAITIKAEKIAADSRYAKIVEVMKHSEENRPTIRRLGDKLGAIYTPLALLVAGAVWAITGEPVRFLSVLVVATPCPLLIGIPVAVIGSIALCAKRSIIVRNPTVFEQIQNCRTAIFDKTGTLTYGEPELAEEFCSPQFSPDKILCLAASLERYSKHPLAHALKAASEKKGLILQEVSEIREIPGEGLRGLVAGQEVLVTSRGIALKKSFLGLQHLPPVVEGLECVVILDKVYAATYKFRDTPRLEGPTFIQHLGPRHQFDRTLIVSGDRESEVRYLAEKVGITMIHAEKSPENKVEIVREETKKAKTLYVGDGINDAPALMAATVGVAIGRNSDITSSAAGAVVLDSSLVKVDELMHISRRMRTIALQSAVGGMVLSIIAMIAAGTGHLTPVGGAVTQEVIDLLAVLNALRAAFPPKELSDF